MDFVRTGPCAGFIGISGKGMRFVVGETQFLLPDGDHFPARNHFSERQIRQNTADDDKVDFRRQHRDQRAQPVFRVVRPGQQVQIIEDVDQRSGGILAECIGHDRGQFVGGTVGRVRELSDARDCLPENLARVVV